MRILSTKGCSQTESQVFKSPSINWPRMVELVVRRFLRSNMNASPFSSPRIFLIPTGVQRQISIGVFSHLKLDNVVLLLLGVFSIEGIMFLMCLASLGEPAI